MKGYIVNLSNKNEEQRNKQMLKPISIIFKKISPVSLSCFFRMLHISLLFINSCKLTCTIPRTAFAI